MKHATAYLESLEEALRNLPIKQIHEVCDVLYRAYLENKTVFLFGNGGSAALASHMACDLGKGTFAPDHVPLAGVKRFRVLSLTDNVPMMSAWANDTSYENVFAEQLANFIAPGDIAFGISGSGNSTNVLKALRLACDSEAITVGLVGNGGGRMKSFLRYAIVIPSSNIQHVEDLHLVVSHILFLELRERISRRSHAAQATAVAVPGALQAQDDQSGSISAVAQRIKVRKVGTSR